MDNHDEVLAEAQKEAAESKEKIIMFKDGEHGWMWETLNTYLDHYQDPAVTDYAHVVEPR